MKNNIDYIIFLLNSYTKQEDNVFKKEMGEQEAAAASGGGKKPPYPTVTKWASGRKFGPTYNPEQKIWSSGVVRGKANTLL